VSDADLRELERRFRETGSVEDEAAWLRERVRVGQLDETRVQLAAHCGLAAALLATESPMPTVALDTLVTWAEVQRTAHCSSVAVRAAVASARAAIADWEQEAMLHAMQVIHAVESWALCPCLEHAVAAGEALDALHAELDVEAAGETRSAFALDAVIHAANYASTRDGRLREDLFEWAGKAASHAVESAGRSVGVPAVLDAVRAELVPWALGYADPVRERVEARQRAEAKSE